MPKKKQFPVKRYHCPDSSCGSAAFLAPARKSPAPRCPQCASVASEIGSRGPAPGEGGRKPVENPRTISLGVRVTEHIADGIDMVRGGHSRSEWLRLAIDETLLAAAELNQSSYPSVSPAEG